MATTLTPDEKRARGAETQRRWREANPERDREQRLAWRAANRERLNEQARARRAADPERALAYEAKWREGRTPEQREATRAGQRASYYAHPETYSTYRDEHRAERSKGNRDRWRALPEEERLAIARDSWRAKGRERRYGVTEAQFLAMVAAQNNQCAICHMDFGVDRYRDAPHLDHDHATGRARGLLCRGCNFILGRAHDDPEVLISAAAYLKERGQ